MLLIVRITRKAEFQEEEMFLDLFEDEYRTFRVSFLNTHYCSEVRNAFALDCVLPCTRITSFLFEKARYDLSKLRTDIHCSHGVVCLVSLANILLRSCEVVWIILMRLFTAEN